MPVYRNTDSETRIWPTLQRPDGRTLELAPGEEAEVGEEIAADPWLAPVARATPPAEPLRGSQVATGPARSEPAPQSTPPSAAAAADAPKE